MLNPAQSRAYALMRPLANWPGPEHRPRVHQAQAVAMMLGVMEQPDEGGFLLAHDMGTGKTMSVLCAAMILAGEGKLKSMLAVCPKSVVGAWTGDASMLTHPHLDVLALTKGSAKSEAQLTRKLLEREQTRDRRVLIVVVNYEMSWRILRHLQLARFDLVAADESQKIKSRTTDQSKGLHKLARTVDRRILMSGTPIPEGGLDWFSQWLFANKNVLGDRFMNFASRYGRQENVTRTQKVWKFNPSMQSELEQLLMPRMHRVTKDDALDLPDETDIPRYFDLEPKSRKMYDDLVRDSIIELHDWYGVVGEVVADHALTKIMRLHQLTCGHVQVEDTSSVTRVGDEKLKACVALLEEAVSEGQKVVVFHRFREDGARVGEWLAKKKIEHAVVNGSVSGDDRISEVQRFQTDPECKVFVAQIAAAGTGITLTAASTTIFFSTSFSSADFDQARARVHRMGQTSKVTHYHLLARDTVDEDILSALLEKRSIAEDAVDGGWSRYLRGHE